ncbi:GumC family protein [Zobellia sp. B3R18]|uniref:GumC family protein n=1 Tax=Zobellia sp. B3R18 TaxID=2841568 RepID=UPI001C0681F0|nr:polysaccharide biosynthesis tyrosine autokinase [Zobellia sp. B3R18]MBU2975501.1 polysaccharide biosynthesis tyrosine autokinase [Zobellia sp. B3R18]
MSHNDDKESFVSEKKPFEIREIIEEYLRFWKWFVLSVLLALVLAVGYLKLKQPVYKALASVILEDEESKSPGGDAGGFVDLGMLGGLGTSSIENELGLIRSKRLMTNAVKALDLNIGYFEPKGFGAKELYTDAPYRLRLVRLDEVALQKTILAEQNVLEIQKVDENTVTIEQAESDYKATHKLGDIIEMGFADFVVESNVVSDTLATEDLDLDMNVEVQFYLVDQVASALRGQLEVALMDENSTLIQLNIEGNVQKKSEDILDQLIFEYNQEAIEDKNLIARNTAFFIDERLSIINSELDSVETGKEKFKTANMLTNIEAESSIIIQNVSDYNNKQQEVLTELEMTNAMIEHVSSSKLNLLPANMGLAESGMVQLVDEYNQLVLERNRLLKGATETNPLVVNLGNQLQEIKENISESLRRRRSNLLITKDNLSRQAGILGSQISEVPSQEREFRGIERQQNIKEALYLFLLQKREENSLSLAAKAPKAKIVDKAYSLNAPISPNKKMVLGIGLLGGLIVPFLIITANKFLNNKINTREELKDVAKGTTVVGEIPHVMAADSTVVSVNERSVLSESFSILRANLNYVMPDKGTSGKGSCIYVTSSAQGEGKTFTVINLALILAESGKSVVMVGGDLRNPQLHRHENKPISTEGLSTYLASSNTELSSYLEDSSLNKNLKVLPSGPVPPNPIQLLGKDKMGAMLEELKSTYDYVIVDTAPAMILADTFLISKYADLTLYLIRAGQTEKKVLEFALEAKAEGKLKNMSFLLNDVKIADATYGSKYGYMYGNEKAKK